MKNSQFQPKSLQVRHVGRHIKSSKIKYTWEFILDNRSYNIELFVSRISGKRRIVVNGLTFANEKHSRGSLSNYYLNIGTHKVVLTELRENFFDLFIDEASFETEARKNNEGEVSGNRIERKERSVEGLNSAEVDLVFDDQVYHESNNRKNQGGYVYQSPPSTNLGGNLNSFDSQYNNMDWGKGKFK